MPSEKLQKYIEIDKTIKTAEKEKEKQKPYIVKLLSRCKSMGVKTSNISYIEAERFSFNEEKLYRWVTTQVDKKTLKTLTKQTIDLEKLQEAYLDGKIDSTKMPAECYTSTKYLTIRISHK